MLPNKFCIEWTVLAELCFECGYFNANQLQVLTKSKPSWNRVMFCVGIGIVLVLVVICGASRLLEQKRCNSTRRQWPVCQIMFLWEQSINKLITDSTRDSKISSLTSRMTVKLLLSSTIRKAKSSPMACTCMCMCVCASASLEQPNMNCHYQKSLKSL